MYIYIYIFTYYICICVRYIVLKQPSPHIINMKQLITRPKYDWTMPCQQLVHNKFEVIPRSQHA